MSNNAENEEVMSAAVKDVVDERVRQIEVEGFDAENDDRHMNGELALAASAYAIHSYAARNLSPELYGTGSSTKFVGDEDLFPFDLAWWKPKSRRQDLVRGGALILAEIERLDRAANIRAGNALHDNGRPVPDAGEEPSDG